jgi:hypothetical protein
MILLYGNMIYFSLSFGMKTLVNLLQFFLCHVCIDLSCGYIHVSKEFLHGPQVSAVLKEMRGEGMS